MKKFSKSLAAIITASLLVAPMSVSAEELEVNTEAVNQENAYECPGPIYSDPGEEYWESVLADLDYSDDELVGAVSINAPITAENILALIKDYDADGAYILQYSLDHKRDFMFWWSGKSRIVDGMDTGVHEQCHYFQHSSWDGKVYVGNKQSIAPVQTAVFKTSSIANTIPESLRTFRYDTYFANTGPIASPDLTSDKYGPYGLIDEFDAYCYGMKASQSLRPYLYANNAMNVYYSDCGNDIQAYAEFRYFILHYLKYAKQNKPSVYEGIVNNLAYCKAFVLVDTQFRKQIDEFIAKDGTSRISFWYADYEMLMNEVKKPEYDNIYKLIYSNSSKYTGKEDNNNNSGGTSTPSTSDWDLDDFDWGTDTSSNTGTNTGTNTNTNTNTNTVTITVGGNKSPFSDVADKKSFYYDSVLWAVKNGVTTGTSATTFEPNKKCTRAQVVTFLWRAMGQPKPNIASPFADVANPRDYYYDAVAWAYENKITTGKTATRFAPNDTVTRGEFVTFLHRAKGNPATYGGCQFTDVPSGTFYYEPVVWAYENAVTTGKSTYSFAPKAACTRAEVVTFIYRAMK